MGRLLLRTFQTEVKSLLEGKSVYEDGALAHRLATRTTDAPSFFLE